MSALEIRRLRPSDEAAFLRLMEQVSELHRRARPDLFRPARETLASQKIGGLLDNPAAVPLLAEWEGEPVGLCILLFQEPDGKNPFVLPRRVGWVKELVVDERFRGRGIGSALLGEAKRRAAEWGAESLELMVWAFNEGARRLYGRFGMTEKVATLELPLKQPPAASILNPFEFEGTRRRIAMHNRLPIKRLTQTARLPVRQTEGSAGYDLCADLPEPKTLAPGERALIPTGLAMAIGDPGIVGLVFARSGLAVKHGVAPANCVGVIDSDYRGELLVPLANHSGEAYAIQPGERIAQLLFVPVCLPELTEVEELDGTGRGEGGFGSTGRD